MRSLKLYVKLYRVSMALEEQVNKLSQLAAGASFRA
jgi:hypothetical protein